MRASTRLGLSLIILGLSLTLSLAFRSLSAPTESWRMEISPQAYDEYIVVSGPRYLRIKVKVEAPPKAKVNLHLLDEEGLRLWVKINRLLPLHSVKNVSEYILTFKMPKRGIYALVIHNPNAFRLSVTTSLTPYGLEEDVPWLLITFITSGLITMGSPLILKLTHRLLFIEILSLRYLASVYLP